VIGQLHAVLQVVAARHVTSRARPSKPRRDIRVIRLLEPPWTKFAATHHTRRLTPERPAQPTRPREHQDVAVPPRRRWAKQRRAQTLMQRRRTWTMTGCREAGGGCRWVRRTCWPPETEGKGCQEEGDVVWGEKCNVCLYQGVAPLGGLACVFAVGCPGA
jgi:hypothetical protein